MAPRQGSGTQEEPQFRELTLCMAVAKGRSPAERRQRLKGGWRWEEKVTASSSGETRRPAVHVIEGVLKDIQEAAPTSRAPSDWHRSFLLLRRLIRREEIYQTAALGAAGLCAMSEDSRGKDL